MWLSLLHFTSCSIFVLFSFLFSLNKYSRLSFHSLLCKVQKWKCIYIYIFCDGELIHHIVVKKIGRLFVYTKLEVIQRFIAALFHMLPELSATRPLKNIIWLNWSCYKLTQPSESFHYKSSFMAMWFVFNLDKCPQKLFYSLSASAFIDQDDIDSKMISYSDHVWTSWVQNELRINIHVGIIWRKY